HRESKKEVKGPTLEGSDVGSSARKRASVLPSKAVILCSGIGFPAMKPLSLINTTSHPREARKDFATYLEVQCLGEQIQLPFADCEEEQTT
ncbi:hypothetical protein KUCAC02_020111, partial [Chaenocephalus aceratus]